MGDFTKHDYMDEEDTYSSRILFSSHLDAGEEFVSLDEYDLLVNDTEPTGADEHKQGLFLLGDIGQEIAVFPGECVDLVAWRAASTSTPPPLPSPPPAQPSTAVEQDELAKIWFDRPSELSSVWQKYDE